MKNRKGYSIFRSSKGNKTKTTTVVVYNRETEKILQELKANLPKIEKRARLDGAGGIPEFDQTTPSDTEMGLKSTFEGGLRNSLKGISLVIESLKEKRDALKRSISSSLNNSPHEAIEDILAQGSHPLAQAIQAINDEAESKIQILENKKRRLKKELGRDEIEKDGTEEELEYRPRKKPWWFFLGYFIFVISVAGSDISVTYSNIEEAAEVPRALSMVIANAIAVIIALIAHFLGKSLKERNRTGIVLSLVAGFVFLAIVTTLATVYGNWLTALINIAMFLALSMVSYFFADKDAKLINKYLEDQAAIEKGEEKIARIDADKIKIRKNAKSKTLQLIQEVLNDVSDQYNKVCQDLREWLAYRDNTKDCFTSEYVHQVYRYRNLNQDARKDKEIPPVKLWRESNYIPPLCISGDDENANGMFDSSPVPPSNNGTPAKSGNALLSLLFIGTLALLLSSCDFLESGGVETEAWVLIDQTEEEVFRFSPRKIATWLFDQIDLDTTTTFGPTVSITVSGLNNRYTNQKWTASLPESGSAFTEITKERLAKQQAFFEETLETLGKVYFTGELPRSRLYHPICEAMNQLRQSSAEKKIGLIFSDGLENTKNFSFYQYRRHPERLLKNKEAIIKKLEEECILPKLTGIDLYIIHQPRLELDELFFAVKQFWQSYFEEKGATVHFLAGI